MLLKFAVKNYRGFAERIEWDLTKHSNYEFNRHVICDGIIKNGIIYGPNGSGKTNFSLAIFDIVHHLTEKNRQLKIYYEKNFINGFETDKLVEFYYEFKFGKNIVKYEYKKNALAILVYEKMEVNDKVIFENDKGKLTLDNDEFHLPPQIIKMLAKNINSVSIIRLLYNTVPLGANHYLVKLQNFVDSMLWFRGLRQNEYVGFTIGRTDLIEFIVSNNLEKDFETFLREVSGQNFEFTSDKSQKALFCDKSQKVRFESIISTGTESLLLLYYWTKSFEKASFVFIDEFDAFYHYRLSYEICKRLFKAKTQLFLSTHNTHLMTNDLLRPDCNFILDKNIIKPLCDCTEKELREGHNIEKLYRGNTFEV